MIKNGSYNQRFWLRNNFICKFIIKTVNNLFFILQYFPFWFPNFRKHSFADKKNSYFCNVFAGIAQLVEHNAPTGGLGPNCSLKNNLSRE